MSGSTRAHFRRRPVARHLGRRGRSGEPLVRSDEEAFWSYGFSIGEVRAFLRDAIVSGTEARGARITEIGTQEAGLPEGLLPNDLR